MNETSVPTYHCRMPTQQQIDRFTLAFHRLAVQRLQLEPHLQRQALAVLDRWDAAGLSPASSRYRQEWRHLLTGDVARLQAVVCADTDHSATLRGMSPLGFVLDDAERLRVRREAMAA